MITDDTDSDIDFDPFAGGEILRVSPTTLPQREIIASAQMSDEANTAFNEAVSLTIDGDIDKDLLEKCFNELLQRHDILRATFSRKGDELCLQALWDLEIDYSDLRSCSEEEQEREIESLWNNISISPMYLEEGPLLHVWLKQLSDNRYELIIAVHHLVADGWSIDMLLQELVVIYRAKGSSEELPPAESFFDFAEQNTASQIANLDTDYWLDKFKELPPTLDLPVDFSRPFQRTFRAERLDYELAPELTEALPKAAATVKSSLVNYVLAGYFSLLHRLTGSTDIVVGLPIAGQAALNRPNQLGHMVQLLPVRVRLNGDTPFSDLVAAVKTAVLDASEHPNFTFGKLVETLPVDRSRVPLIATLFNIDRALPPLDFGTARASLRTVPRAAENFEMFLNFVQDEGGFLVEATYSSLLFEQETIHIWLQSLEILLQSVIIQPQMLVQDLPLASDIPAVLADANDTRVNTKFPDLVSAFEACLPDHANKTAIVMGDAKLGYKELSEHIDGFACKLHSAGIGENDIVAICCQRSEKMVIAALAILKLGAAYLPLDPGFPDERLSFMLEDSGAIALIEDSTTPEKLKSTDIQHIAISEGIENSSDGSIPEIELDPQRLAYIIYTSGSTGKPKGVKVSTEAMVNFLESMAREPGCKAEDRLLAVTTLSFDISVLELFLPLICGAELVIASQDDASDGRKIEELIEKHNITIMQATPSTWRLLFNAGWKTARKNLKVLCGGEPLLPDLVAAMLPMVSELWNMYGPTETTVWSTCKRITTADQTINVGKPIANTQVYVLDQNHTVLPCSIPGELCIGGDGLALGYHDRDDLTAERFIDHPKLGRLYKTGDMAKVCLNGEIQHLGRIDDQVKVRGYRIELGDIEAALVSAPNIESAAAYIWDTDPNDVRIVACYVPVKGVQISSVQIRKHMRSLLPAYMLPHNFISLSELPLTPNRKINRKMLPRPERQASIIDASSELHTNTEKHLSEIWSSLIKPDSPIGRQDNFFEMGGHSLLAMEAIRQVEVKSGARLKPADMVDKRLYELAEIVDAQSVSGGDLVPVAPSAQQVRRISSVQQRIFDIANSDPEVKAFNLSEAFIIKGDIRFDVLIESLEYIYRRQSALRTKLRKAEQGIITYLDKFEFADYVKLVDYSGSECREEEVIAEMTALSQQCFLLLESPLSRMTVYKLSDNACILYVLSHQIIFDGFSLNILLKELEQVYCNNHSGNNAQLDNLPIDFRDFAAWHLTKPVSSDAKNYFQSLEKMTSHHAISIADTGSNGVGRIVDTHEAEAHQAMVEFADNNNYRYHELLFAIYALAISKANGISNFTVGMPVSGREYPEIIGLIGAFVSNLPVLCSVDRNNEYESVASLVEQVRNVIEHKDISYLEAFEKVGLSREKQIFNTCFSIQDITDVNHTFYDLSLKPVDMPRPGTECAVDCWVRVNDQSSTFFYDYDLSKVDEEQVRRISKEVQLIVRKIASKEIAESSMNNQPKAKRKSMLGRLFS